MELAIVIFFLYIKFEIKAISLIIYQKILNANFATKIG